MNPVLEAEINAREEEIRRNAEKEQMMFEQTFGPKPKQKNAIEALIGVLRSPIAQRQGWHFSANECEMWAEELEKILKNE